MKGCGCCRDRSAVAPPHGEQSSARRLPPVYRARPLGKSHKRMTENAFTRYPFKRDRRPGDAQLWPVSPCPQIISTRRCPTRKRCGSSRVPSPDALLWLGLSIAFIFSKENAI